MNILKPTTVLNTLVMGPESAFTFYGNIASADRHFTRTEDLVVLWSKIIL